MVAMNRYMLILSLRIPVIKAHVSNVYIEKGNWSLQLNKHSTHLSIHGTNVSEFCLQFMLIDLFCSWYYSISMYIGSDKVFYRVYFDLLWHWMDVPVNEAQCCMLLSLFTVVYIIFSGVPHNISTLFKYPMCFYNSHYELITVLLSIMHTK